MKTTRSSSGRFVAGLCQVAYLSLVLTGCYGVCDSWLWYDVRGQIVDAESGTELGQAEIAVSLLRNGENIQDWGDFVETTTGADGTYRTEIIVDHAGGLCGGIFGSLPELQFGEPPDEVVITVQLNGRSGVGRASIDPTTITIKHALSREIDLPTVEIDFSGE